MARWTEMSVNKSYNRKREIERERDYNFECDILRYGLIEDINDKNCYSVEDVYFDLDNWN